MSWVAVAIGGAAVVSAVVGSQSANRAASAQERGADAAIREDRRQYDQTREDFAPYREAGGAALSRLNRLSSGDFSSFEESPGYQFRISEGEKALNRRQSATSGLLSGAGFTEALRQNQGMSSNEFGNYWNRQAGLAGVGQTATGSTAQAGAGAAGRIGNAMIGAGNARGDAYMQGGQAINNAVQGGVRNYLLYDYLRPGSGGGGSGYSVPANVGTY